GAGPDPFGAGDGAVEDLGRIPTGEADRRAGGCLVIDRESELRAGGERVGKGYRGGDREVPQLQVRGPDQLGLVVVHGRVGLAEGEIQFLGAPLRARRWAPVERADRRLVEL